MELKLISQSGGKLSAALKDIVRLSQLVPTFCRSITDPFMREELPEVYTLNHGKYISELRSIALKLGEMDRTHLNADFLERYKALSEGELQRLRPIIDDCYRILDEGSVDGNKRLQNGTITHPSPIASARNVHYLLKELEVMLFGYGLHHPIEVEHTIQSCLGNIVQSARNAALTYKGRQTDVFGWKDQHVMRDSGASFLVTKHFTKIDAMCTANQTFNMMLSIDQYRMVQRWISHLAVLYRYNDDTYLVLWEYSDPNTKVRFQRTCLVFRIVDEDENIIIVTAKSMGDCVEENERGQKPPRMLFSCSFTYASQPSSSTDGFYVHLAGEIDTGSNLGDRRVIADALQYALRWENACVAPLFQLRRNE